MRQVLIVLALVVAACGGTATSLDPAGDAGEATTTSSTEAPVTTAVSTAPRGSSATTVPPSSTNTTMRVRPDGPDAPDFTLALGQGGEFTLSQEQKPVFMVFWAEW